MWLKSNVGISVSVLLGLLVISVVTKLLNYNVTATYSNEHLKKGRLLVRQSLQWHAMAEQDTNPFFAARHSNYAIAYLSAARSLLPDQILQKIANVDVHDMALILESAQREHAKNLNQRCPKGNPDGTTNSVKWL